MNSVNESTDSQRETLTVRASRRRDEISQAIKRCRYGSDVIGCEYVAQLLEFFRRRKLMVIDMLAESAAAGHDQERLSCGQGHLYRPHASMRDQPRKSPARLRGSEPS